MKKLALLAVAAVAALGGIGSASADPILCLDIGCAGVGADGYIIVLDGAAGNPDPIDGYIGIGDGWSFACDDEDGPYTNDGDGEVGNDTCPDSIP